MRRRVLADLMGMDKIARKKASGMIEDRLKQLLGEAQCVMAFWPLPSEPDITGILRGLHNYRVEDFSTLKPSSVGVNEPDTTSSEEFAANKIDLVIVPGVAFSRCGDRLGRGGGYYDHFLGRLHPSIPRIAVAFEKQIFRSVPKEPHDIPMHSVITELDTYEREPQS